MISQAVMLRGDRSGSVSVLESLWGRVVLLRVEELVGVSGVEALGEVWDMMRGVIQRE